MKTEEKQNLPYGICPICGARGINRERRLNGDDMCSNFHSYPSKDAVKVNGDTINRITSANEGENNE